MFEFIKKLLSTSQKTSVELSPMAISFSSSSRQVLANIKPYKSKELAEKKNELIKYDAKPWYKKAWHSVTTYLGWGKGKDIEQTRIRYTATIAQQLLKSTMSHDERQAKIVELSRQTKKLAASPVRKTFQKVNGLLSRCGHNTIILQTVDDRKIKEAKEGLRQAYTDAKQNLSLYIASFENGSLDDFSKQADTIRNKFNNKSGTIQELYNRDDIWETYTIKFVHEIRRELNSLEAQCKLEFEKFVEQYQLNFQQKIQVNGPIPVTHNLKENNQEKNQKKEIVTPDIIQQSKANNIMADSDADARAIKMHNDVTRLKASIIELNVKLTAQSNKDSNENAELMARMEARDAREAARDKEIAMLKRYVEQQSKRAQRENSQDQVQIYDQKDQNEMRFR